MNKEIQAYIYLHIAVLLFGFTAILGDLIELSALHIVWWRLLLTSISLFFIVNVVKMYRQISRRRFLIFTGIGLLVGIHWLTFYGSIKLSNASITLVCLATTTLFTSLLEPLIIGRPIYRFEMLLGAIIIPAMALIVSNLDPSLIWGVPVGLASAFFASLFSTLNKKYIHDGKIMQITFIELNAALLLMTAILFYDYPTQLEGLWPSRELDWIYLAVLAFLCTTLAFALSLAALRYISAFASSLTINLEPVYGIILAWWILGDHQELDQNFYFGLLIILVAVFSYPYFRKKRISKT